MAEGPKPVRRVVSGHDEHGRSRVVWDGPAPNAIGAPVGPGRGMTDLWVFHSSPAPLSGERDDGHLPYNFEPPPKGAHLRIVQSRGRQPEYDPAKDPNAVPLHEPRRRPGGTWDRGGNNAYSSLVHKTETVDYGILLEGERVLLLDDGELVMKPGGVVVQVGNWHGWTSPREDCRMAFIMMGATFEDASTGVPPHPHRPIRASGQEQMPAGVKPVRRIVTIDGEDGKSTAISDGPSPDVRTDPARPGFASTRIWVTDATPARITGAQETLHLPHTIEPPPHGSVCRIVTFPPDGTWKGKVGAREVQAFFEAMGPPGASTYSPQAPHPYMQKTRTLDFCVVLEGEVTLVLDTQEVHLQAGDTVIQRGTNHAWSNRSTRPRVVAISSHDGTY